MQKPIPKAGLETMVCLYPQSWAGPLLKGCSCLVYLMSYFTLLFFYMACVTLNNEMRRVKGNSYGLF